MIKILYILIVLKKGGALTTFFVSKNTMESKISVNNRLNNPVLRELDVLRLLTKGLSNREISAELYLSTGTIGVRKKASTINNCIVI